MLGDLDAVLLATMKSNSLYDRSGFTFAFNVLDPHIRLKHSEALYSVPTASLGHQNFPSLA